MLPQQVISEVIAGEFLPQEKQKVAFAFLACEFSVEVPANQENNCEANEPPESKTSIVHKKTSNAADSGDTA